MKILRNEKIVRISKSESFSCLKEVFCPGTIWLLKEHKLCVEELQKLKSMIEDLHRCIFLIHSTKFLILFANFNAKILNYKFQLKVQVHRSDSRTRAISLQCIQRPEKTTDGCKTPIYSLNQSKIFLQFPKKSFAGAKRDLCHWEAEPRC